MVYEAGPAKTETTATASTRLVTAPRSSGIATIASADAIASDATAPARPGAKVGLRSSRIADQTPVAPTAAARNSRAHICPRCRQSITLPMPTSAPMAGARATV